MARPRITENSESPTAPSTLDPDAILEKDRTLGIGHGTDALGPSGTSDSGSDVAGGYGLKNQVGEIGLGTGTTSDPDNDAVEDSAGPDIGDAGLDSDSDATGTGERATAGRDTTKADGNDIDVDHIEVIGEIDNESGDEDKAPTRSQERYRR